MTIDIALLIQACEKKKQMEAYALQVISSGDGANKSFNSKIFAREHFKDYLRQLNNPACYRPIHHAPKYAVYDNIRYNPQTGTEEEYERSSFPGAAKNTVYVKKTDVTIIHPEGKSKFYNLDGFYTISLIFDLKKRHPTKPDKYIFLGYQGTNSRAWKKPVHANDNFNYWLETKVRSFSSLEIAKAQAVVPYQINPVVAMFSFSKNSVCAFGVNASGCCDRINAIAMQQLFMEKTVDNLPIVIYPKTPSSSLCIYDAFTQLNDIIAMSSRDINLNEVSKVGHQLIDAEIDLKPIVFEAFIRFPEKIMQQHLDFVVKKFKEKDDAIGFEFLISYFHEDQSVISINRSLSFSSKIFDNSSVFLTRYYHSLITSENFEVILNEILKLFKIKNENRLIYLYKAILEVCKNQNITHGSLQLNTSQETVWHLAVKNNMQALLRFLLESNFCDFDGLEMISTANRTPLLLASEIVGRDEILSLFLSKTYIQKFSLKALNDVLVHLRSLNDPKKYDEVIGLVELEISLREDVNEKSALQKLVTMQCDLTQDKNNKQKDIFFEELKDRAKLIHIFYEVILLPQYEYLLISQFKSALFSSKTNCDIQKEVLTKLYNFLRSTYCPPALFSLFELLGNIESTTDDLCREITRIPLRELPADFQSIINILILNDFSFVSSKSFDESILSLSRISTEVEKNANELVTIILQNKAKLGSVNAGINQTLLWVQTQIQKKPFNECCYHYFLLKLSIAAQKIIQENEHRAAFFTISSTPVLRALARLDVRDINACYAIKEMLSTSSVKSMQQVIANS